MDGWVYRSIDWRETCDEMDLCTVDNHTSYDDLAVTYISVNHSRLKKNIPSNHGTHHSNMVSCERKKCYIFASNVQPCLFFISWANHFMIPSALLLFLWIP